MQEKRMMNVAIVEDNEADAEVLNSLLDKYCKKTARDINVEVFSDGAQFLTVCRRRQTFFDIIFMDIEMPNIDGMRAARKLREIDPEVCLIFTTNLKQYAVKGYEVEAKAFLVKPITYVSFSTLLDKLLKKVDLYKAEVLINTPNCYHRIRIKDIIFVEVSQHFIIYHTTSEDISFFGSLQTERSKLPTNLFSCCNRCYLVNLAYVKKIDGNYVYVGNDKLMISRNQKKKFIDEFMQFCGRGGE